MAKSKRKSDKPVTLDTPFDKAIERLVGVDPNELESATSPDQVHLVQDDSGHRFIVYASEQGPRAELRFEGDTFWASQRQMADMFGVTPQNITTHLKNIFKEGELVEAAVCKESLHTGRDGKRYTTKFYDLNALISIGYRVGSVRGTIFRVWATGKLFQILTKGFYVDKQHLKGKPDRITELREIIRDIRVDEANIYAELKRICTMCSDYDPSSDQAHTFYAYMQAKLYWAVVSKTPSEILVERVKADANDLGLQTWAGDRISQADALVAKNTLSAAELKELNRVHDILLSVFEDQLDVGRLATMTDAGRLLDAQLAQLGRPVLTHGGSISSTEAKVVAKAQYKIFDDRRKAARKARVDAELAELKKLGKKIGRAKKPKPADQ
jgi:hypothetical protein